MEKVIRTISPKLRQQNYRTLNTLSLPSLKNPKREKVDWLMNTEREKVLQKIRQGYYPNDISYLKDRPLPDPLIKASSSSLSLDIVDIYNKTYSENETELDFLNVSKKQRSKSPQQSLVEKLLSPKRKTQPPPAKNFDIGAPTGRQEAINLTAWFELMKQKYFQKFKELLSGKGNIDRSKVLKAWKSIYLTAFQEIERQTQVHCQERGKLLQDLVEGFASLFEFINSNYLIELHRQSMNHAKEISEARLETAKKLAHFQVKLDFCEKEKFELRHNNGQCIIKIRELERLIEDFRRNEKSNLRGPKVSTQKFPNASFEESPVLQENKETFISVPETLTAEINKKMAKLAELKKKIQEFRETLQVLESEVCDKRAALASLNFEIELRQSLVRPVAKFTPKSIILLSTSKNKKRSDSVILDEEVKNLDIFFNSEEFFKKLLEKPKERLTRKCKISQDHVFQSLSVIYQRAIIQIEIFNEIKDFQGLVYRQFVKLENNKKGEKILKNFISGCLKLSDFLRVSVFLRFLGLGGLISSSNFSTKTLSVYLSAYLLMDSLQVGLLVHKDTSSPSQFYPVVRAQATLKELSTVYPNSSKLSIDSFLSNNLIQDPKQINPQGLIELEKFLQKLAEEYEDLVQDISENCSKIFEIASKRQVLSLDLFLRLIQQVSKEKMLELSENVEKELQDFQEIKVSQGVEVCLKFNLFTTEDILGFLGNLASVSQNFAKNLLLSQYPSPIPSVYQNILDEIEEVPVKFALIWWKFLNNNQ
jgi:hypothetical protein